MVLHLLVILHCCKSGFVKEASSEGVDGLRCMHVLC